MTPLLFQRIASARRVLVAGADLAGLAARSLYLQALEHTETIFEVGAVIEAFRRDVAKRPRRAIPH